MTRACALPLSPRSLARTVLDTDSFPVLVLERMKQASRKLPIPGINRVFRYAQMSVFGIEIGRDAQIGPGVYFVHTLGTIIGGDAKVGARVRLMGNNTIGTAKDNGYPIIDEDVLIGCGARILGPVHIGARAKIGANAVVLCDVPADGVATGIPARVHGPGGEAHDGDSRELGKVTTLRRAGSAS